MATDREEPARPPDPPAGSAPSEAPGGQPAPRPRSAGQPDPDERVYDTPPAYQPGPTGYYDSDNYEVEEEKNAIAPWALGIGLAALLLNITIIGVLVTPLLAIAAIVLAIISFVRSAKMRSGAKRVWMGVVGLVCAVLTLVLLGLGAMLLVSVTSEVLTECGDAIDSGNEQRIEQCLEDAFTE